ncbi:hypothetical protein THOE12_80036 [Vibrio rotiferianus]|nr:hypothetical protein THOE12_80036 [Vibrio rotiferianus]
MGPFFVLEKQTCFVFLGTTPVNAFKIQTAFIRFLKQGALNLLIIQKAAVKEIPDYTPSSLSGMTPFEFRMIKRHPQSEARASWGSFISSHIPALTPSYLEA